VPAGIRHPFQSVSSWYPPSFSVSVQLVSTILFSQCPAGIHHPFQSVSSWYPPSFSVTVQLVSTILFSSPRYKDKKYLLGVDCSCYVVWSTAV
jgi:hypothetical protein